MAISLKKRHIEGYVTAGIRPTREQAEKLHAKIQREISRQHGFAGIKLFGWTFYGGMHKSRDAQ
jgi:hypothetical protein